MRPIGVVEVRDTLACKLKVLALIFADWDMRCSLSHSAFLPSCSCFMGDIPMHQNIRSLENRVREQA